MQGGFEVEFIGDFFHQFHALWKVAIFRQIRKLPDLKPKPWQPTQGGSF
jgi:hypothetical protein